MHPEITEEIKIEIRGRIDKRMLSVKEDIEYLKEVTKPIAPENSLGRISRMDAINNKSVNEAALRSALTKLKQLEYALSHIDESKFGLCSRCGNPIQVKRLIVMPESSRCVKCARI